MKSKFKFENLRMWQDVMNLAEEMNLMIKNFPQKERFNLSSQLLRASDSIGLHISEGSILQTVKQQRRYLNIAIGSLAETVTCLHKAKRRNYLSNDEFNKHYLDCFKLMNMLIDYKKSLTKIV